MPSTIMPCGCPCIENPNPCGCGTCDYDAGEVSYENYVICDGIGLPCGDQEPACANLTMGPITLYSPKNFPTSCLQNFELKAEVYGYFDNGGYIQGITNIDCPIDDANCDVCFVTGTIYAYIQQVNATQSRGYIRIFAQNAPHGGNYGMSVYGQFFLNAL